MLTIAPQAFPDLPIFPRRRLQGQTNFGVRLYVSIVTGGSATVSILSKAVVEQRGFYPYF
ncbi:hypothetical protein [Phormidesmis priestleyi]